MCGIFGILDPTGNYSRSELEQCTNTLIHRGPDDSGYLIAPPVFLGHRRLSIIDLKTGHQPMSNEDGSVHIVFNGEIYNYRELKGSLVQAGHQFKTDSDTETVIHLYEEYGYPDFLNELRGMFAFAVWDSRKQRLVLARDRLGQKPLFYLSQTGKFVFGSELKAILKLNRVTGEIDESALWNYLTYQYVPAPQSIFKGIRKLEPAHAMIFEHGEIRDITRYWKPDPITKTSLSFHEAEQELSRLLTESTELRMISDVPLGAFLSGGIDSSAVVGLMSSISGSPVKTFSIGFNEQGYDELEYARMIAKKFNTDHHELIVTPDALEIFEDLVYYYNEPYADSSAIPTYYVSKFTRENVTVALNGDGGDESFGGYRRYVAAGLYDRLYSYPGFIRNLMMLFGRVLPRASERGSRLSRAKKFLALMKKNPQLSYKYLVSHFNDDLISKLLRPEFLTRTFHDYTSRVILRYFEETPPDHEFLERVMYVDQMTYLPNDLLVKVDIAGMIHSLECRSPFLDHKLVEFAWSLPGSWKVKRGNKKYILKSALKDLLPSEIRNRPKMGFGVPVNRWFRKELKGFVREHLLDPKFIERGYFRREFIEQMISMHQEHKQDFGYQLWNLLFLKLWFDRWA